MCYMAEDDPELLTLLLPPPECYRCARGLTDLLSHVGAGTQGLVDATSILSTELLAQCFTVFRKHPSPKGGITQG